MLFFRNGCKGSAKLDTEIELIYPKLKHNHNVQEYDADRHDIKRKINKRHRLIDKISEQFLMIPLYQIPQVF